MEYKFPNLYSTPGNFRAEVHVSDRAGSDYEWVQFPLIPELRLALASFEIEINSHAASYLIYPSSSSSCRRLPWPWFAMENRRAHR